MSQFEKLFGLAASKTSQFSVDWWVINDGASSMVPDLLGSRSLAHPEKVKVFIDHDVPCGSVEMASAQKKLIQFALDHGCELFNGQGISYQIMLDRFVRQGQIVAVSSPHAPIFGAVNALGINLSPQALADSIVNGSVHFQAPPVSYVEILSAPKAPLSMKDVALSLVNTAEGRLKGTCAEFIGAGIKDLSTADKITLCQMINATGALCTAFSSAATSASAIRIDPATMTEVVAGPHEITRITPLAAMPHIAIDEVFIGGCSGGRIEDLRTAATILRGRRIPPRVRLMVAPATSQVFRQAADEGLIDIFFDAGAMVMGQGCSVCWGRSQGLIGDNEVLLSTGSRCSRGCAGPETSSVYVCSPAVAAHCALKGKFYNLREDQA